MKRISIFFALLLTTIAVMAQSTEISYRIGEVTDMKKVPLIVSLTNSVEITGVGATLYIPNDATCIYDDEDFEEEPDYEAGSRCTKSHDMDNFTEKVTDAGKRVKFYFTSKKSKALSGTEGDVVTIYMDCSKLSNGDYEITTKDNEAVTTSATSCWNETNPTVTFTVNDGKLTTGIDGISADEPAEADSAIYTLDGIKRQKMVKGQVNVINGRKFVK